MSTPPAATEAPPDRAVTEFEAVYRANVAGVTAFFARRCYEPQAVADLTSETFVQAIGSLRSFDPSRGSTRAWLYGIARHVYARHCARTANGHHTLAALAGHRELEDDEVAAPDRYVAPVTGAKDRDRQGPRRARPRQALAAPGGRA